MYICCGFIAGAWWVFTMEGGVIDICLKIGGIHTLFSTCRYDLQICAPPPLVSHVCAPIVPLCQYASRKPWRTDISTTPTDYFELHGISIRLRSSPVTTLLTARYHLLSIPFLSSVSCLQRQSDVNGM